MVLRDGQADRAGTDALRERVRESRRSRMTAPKPRLAGTPTGGSTGIWGASLVTWESSEGLLASCRHCDQVLGPLADGWESIAGRVTLGSDDLGDRVKVHSDLTAVAHICPHCATALWVDVEPVDGKPWRDFTVHA